MQQKNIKAFIFPIIAIFIFAILLFAAGYAYFVGSTSMNTANYQVTLPKVTTLTCSKTDCNVTLTPQMMYNTNTNATTPKATSTCYVNCTCSGTQGGVCNYNVSLIEASSPYSPSSALGTNKEFTIKVTSPSGCTAQNSSASEIQINTIKNKVVSNCSLTIPSSGSVTANVAAEFKWYNLNIDQSRHAQKNYNYNLTAANEQYTVTYNANGGSVSPATTIVNYPDTYKNLATPTYSGHTFRGWNGKNILDRNSSSLAGIKNETEGQYWASIAFNNNWVINYLKPSTTYTMSYDLYCISLPEHDATYSNSLGFYLYSGVSGYTNLWMGYGGDYIAAGENRRIVQTFTTPANLHDTAANYRVLVYSNLYKLNGSYNPNGSYLSSHVIYSNIMIEEGSTATPFEPFLITTDTIVTQKKNHTLKAIWN